MNEVLVCPLCGFSFKYSDSKTIKQKIKCPMCGYEFSSFPLKEFDKKF